MASSLALEMAAALTADEGSSDGGFVGLDVFCVVDEVVSTPVFLLRRLILRPDSSSKDEKPESESEAWSEVVGGGVAGRFRRADWDLALRFLKANCGGAVSVAEVGSSMAGYWGRQQ